MTTDEMKSLIRELQDALSDMRDYAGELPGEIVEGDDDWKATYLAAMKNAHRLCLVRVEDQPA